MSEPVKIYVPMKKTKRLHAVVEEMVKLDSAMCDFMKFVDPIGCYPHHTECLDCRETEEVLHLCDEFRDKFCDFCWQFRRRVHATIGDMIESDSSRYELVFEEDPDECED